MERTRAHTHMKIIVVTASRASEYEYNSVTQANTRRLFILTISGIAARSFHYIVLRSNSAVLFGSVVGILLRRGQ